MAEDPWAALADRFVDESYPAAKGQIRTYVLHQQLMEHLAGPTSVLDIGGGAGNQTFPLARLGHSATIADPSEAMLAKAESRLAHEDPEVRARVRLVRANGEDAAEATGQQFGAVLCHGVITYLEEPGPLLDALAQCTAPGGVISVMTLNAHALPVRPALERRWQDALPLFDARHELGPLGVETRGDTAEELSGQLAARGLDLLRWYGVWLFADWLDLGEAEPEEVAQAAAVELKAGARDPYRQLARAIHVVARRA